MFGVLIVIHGELEGKWLFGTFFWVIRDFCSGSSEGLGGTPWTIIHGPLNTSISSSPIKFPEKLFSLHRLALVFG
jgi:hypothetical protein